MRPFHNVNINNHPKHYRYRNNQYPTFLDRLEFLILLVVPETGPNSHLDNPIRPMYYQADLVLHLHRRNSSPGFTRFETFIFLPISSAFGRFRNRSMGSLCGCGLTIVCSDFPDFPELHPPFGNLPIVPRYL